MFKTFKYLLVMLLPLGAIAQQGTVSPYSRFGLGDLTSQSTSAEFGMGSLSLASFDSTRLHLGNPANLSNIGKTIFQFGVFGEGVKMKTTSASLFKGTSNLNYIGMAFPIAKWWKSGVSFMPYSSVGYQINDRQELDSIKGVNYIYQGSGGLNQLQWSNAFIPVKGLSVGLAASYYFGALDRGVAVEFDSTAQYENTRILYRSYVSDFALDLGLSYQKELANDMRLGLGASYGKGMDLSATRNEVLYNYMGQFGSEFNRDTTVNREVQGALTLPTKFGFGVNLAKMNKWTLGADYKMQDWSEYSFFGTNDSLKNSYQFNVGASYIPNYRAVKSYLAKVTYRMGFSYGQTYLSLRNQSLKDYGISFGLGLPLRNSRYGQDEINIGFVIGKRGTTESDLIEENYFRLKVGVVLNDRWFIKRKID